MEISFNTSSVIAAVAIATAGSSAFAADKCELALRGTNEEFVTETKWRTASTNEVSGTIVPTYPLRENTMSDVTRDMVDKVERNSTPIMDVVFSPDVYFVRTQYGRYNTGEYPKFDVTTGGDPVLRGTLLLPVSGHTGIANARVWAKSDTYSIWAEIDGKKIYLVKDAPSLDLITHQEIAVPLVKDKEVLIFYQRSGNSIYGYIEGRKMGFTWNGQ